MSGLPTAAVRRLLKQYSMAKERADSNSTWFKESGLEGKYWSETGKNECMKAVFFSCDYLLGSYMMMLDKDN